MYFTLRGSSVVLHIKNRTTAINNLYNGFKSFGESPDRNLYWHSCFIDYIARGLKRARLSIFERYAENSRKICKWDWF